MPTELLIPSDDKGTKDDVVNTSANSSNSDAWDELERVLKVGFDQQTLNPVGDINKALGREVKKTVLASKTDGGSLNISPAQGRVCGNFKNAAKEPNKFKNISADEGLCSVHKGNISKSNVDAAIVIALTAMSCFNGNPLGLAHLLGLVPAANSIASSFKSHGALNELKVNP